MHDLLIEFFRLGFLLGNRDQHWRTGVVSGPECNALRKKYGGILKVKVRVIVRRIALPGRSAQFAASNRRSKR